MKIKDCMKRNVVSIRNTSTLGEAVEMLVARHIGLLPVVDGKNKLVGVLGIRDLLSLALPSFVKFLDDLDFVRDFGAVESTHPSPEILMQPVTKLMRPATSVQEESGLLRAYSLMIQHKLHDLPVVQADGTLAGIASRVDIGTAIMAGWKSGSQPGP